MTGRSRAVPAAATAWPRGSRRRLPGRNRRNGRRFLPGGRAVPANRPAGSCPTAGQEPPRSGGSCQRFLPDGRAGTASVGRFLRRSRAATAAPLLGAAPPLCGRFLAQRSPEAQNLFESTRPSCTNFSKACSNKSPPLDRAQQFPDMFPARAAQSPDPLSISLKY
jgi:hypothetical protein